MRDLLKDEQEYDEERYDDIDLIYSLIPLIRENLILIALMKKVDLQSLCMKSEKNIKIYLRGKRRINEKPVNETERNIAHFALVCKYMDTTISGILTLNEINKRRIIYGAIKELDFHDFSVVDAYTDSISRSRCVVMYRLPTDESPFCFSAEKETSIDDGKSVYRLSCNPCGLYRIYGEDVLEYEREYYSSHDYGCIFDDIVLLNFCVDENDSTYHVISPEESKCIELVDRIIDGDRPWIEKMIKKTR